MTDKYKKDALSLLGTLRGLSLRIADSAVMVQVQAKIHELERIINR